MAIQESALDAASDRRWPQIRADLRELRALAVPVVAAELGWMAMGLVDTLMVGPLGPAAIGAVGLGASVFMAVAIFGMGLLLGLDTLVSQAFGGGRLDECRRWLLHGLVLGLVVSIPMTAGLLWAARHAPLAGLHPDVERLVVPYLTAVTWSLVPLLLYAACRRYLQGMSIVRPVTFALVSANIVNALANYVLIYGGLGLPAFGVTGAAWATVVSRIYMVAVLGVAVVVADRQSHVTVRSAFDGVHLESLRRLFALGLPASLQITLEVGVFATATVLAGRLAPESLAAHQIALNLAGTIFMVPLGVATSAAVLVGQAIGRRDTPGAARAGWTALGAIVCFMLGAAAVLLLMPHALLRPFTADRVVLAAGAQLLAVAAVFQLFDGLQVVATGALRGVGDTRTPMLWNLVGHWAIGLPVAYVACFPLGWGVVGLWFGLAAGLMLCGVVLLRVWAIRVRALT
jgi:MATE family multidrug resistance protein